MILNNEPKKKKFEQFFIMTYPKVKAFAWKLLKSEEDAEDIAQVRFFQDSYDYTSIEIFMTARLGKPGNLEQLHLHYGPQSYL